MPGLLSNLIAQAGTEHGEDLASVTHVWGHVSMAHVVHAVAPRVRLEPWDDVRAATERGGGRWIVFAPPVELTPDQFVRWREALVEVCGRRYSWVECGLQGLDRGIGKLLRMRKPPLAFRRLQDVLPGMMCAHVVGRALNHAGQVPRDDRARYGDPDDLYDLLLVLGWKVRAMSEGWEQVRNNKTQEGQ